MFPRAPLAALVLWTGGFAGSGCQESANQPTVSTLPSLLSMGQCSVSVGAVDLKTRDKGWEPIERGDAVFPEDRVRTGSTGFARLDLGARGVLRLDPSAEILLRPPKHPGAVAVIESGTVRAELDAPAGGPGQRLVFALPSRTRATVEARSGGAAQLRLTRRDDILEVAVLQGEALVTALAPEPLILRAGEAMEVNPKEATEPQPLLMPPAMAAPSADERYLCPGLALKFAWLPLVGAKSYRLQIAKDDTFQTLAFNLETERTQSLWLAREPARYSWRVQAQDASGRWGAFSPGRRFHCEPTAPEEFLISPLAGARIKDSSSNVKVEFSWKPMAGASGYKWLVVKGSSLERSPTRQGETEQTQIEVELSDGEYVWGVYSQDGAPLFLQPRKLEIDTPRSRSVKVTPALRDWGQ